jgi:hypothetical protein
VSVKITVTWIYTGILRSNGEESFDTEADALRYAERVRERFKHCYQEPRFTYRLSVEMGELPADGVHPVLAALLAMDDDARARVMGHFCRHCHRHTPEGDVCHCENDE